MFKNGFLTTFTSAPSYFVHPYNSQINANHNNSWDIPMRTCGIGVKDEILVFNTLRNILSCSLLEQRMHTLKKAKERTRVTTNRDRISEV